MFPKFILDGFFCCLGFCFVFSKLEICFDHARKISGILETKLIAYIRCYSMLYNIKETITMSKKKDILYYSIRVVKAKSKKEAIEKVIAEDFETSDRLCDDVVPQSVLERELKKRNSKITCINRVSQ